MTFSNFKPLGSRFAEIDITTGMWWWKRTRTRVIQKEKRPFGQWFYMDTKNICPIEVHECEREYYGRVK